jgi:hypothetical protein
MFQPLTWYLAPCRMPWQRQLIIGLRKVNRLKACFYEFIPVTNSVED